MREEEDQWGYTEEVRRVDAINYFRELSAALDSVFDADLRTISSVHTLSPENTQQHELTLLMPGVCVPVVTVDSLTSRESIHTLSQKRLDLRSMKNLGKRRKQ